MVYFSLIVSMETVWLAHVFIVKFQHIFRESSGVFRGYLLRLMHKHFNFLKLLPKSRSKLKIQVSLALYLTRQQILCEYQLQNCLQL